MDMEIAHVPLSCGTLHLAWNRARHCHTVIQWLLPNEGTLAAVMHYATVTLTTDTDRALVKKIYALFLNRALGNYPAYCSMRKPVYTPSSL